MEKAHSKKFIFAEQVLPALLILLCFLATFIPVAVVRRNGASDPSDKTYSVFLTEDWHPGEGTRLRIISLTTFRLSPDRSGICSISASVPSEASGDRILCFRSDCDAVSVFVNSECVFSRESGFAGGTNSDILSLYRIPLANLCAGDVIRADFLSGPGPELQLNEISLGTETAVRHFIFRTNLSSFVAIVFSLLIFVQSLLIFIYLLAKRRQRWELLYLAIGGILSAFLLLTDSGLSVFVFRSEVFSHYLRFICAALVPVSFLLVIQRLLPGKTHLITAFWLSQVLLGVVLFLLNLYGSVPLYYAIPLMMPLSMTETAVVTVCVFLPKNRSSHLLKVFTATLFAGVFFTAAASFLTKHLRLTGTFRYVISVLFAMELVIVLLELTKIDRREKELRLQKENAEIRMTLAQINFHFFFNTINTIRGLILTDADGAYKMTGDLGRYLRYRAHGTDSETDLTAFHEELRAIRAYADICKIRMNDNLNVIYDIETEDFSLPVLTVEPFVENAIQHGIFEGTGSGTVTVRTRAENGGFTVEIADNGKGFDTAAITPEESLGIENIKKRLSFYPGCSVRITSAPGSGTVVTLRLPKMIRSKYK